MSNISKEQIVAQNGIQLEGIQIIIQMKDGKTTNRRPKKRRVQRRKFRMLSIIRFVWRIVRTVILWKIFD